MLTGGDGGDSCGDFGLEGRRPRRPFKLSVLTTVKRKTLNRQIIDILYILIKT